MSWQPAIDPKPGDTFACDHAGPQKKFGRPHLIEEYEWPDHLSLRGWQRPPHGKAAEVPCAGYDDYVNRVTGECVTRLGIYCRLPAHFQPINMRWTASWNL